MAFIRRKFFYDTQVISGVQSGAIPQRDWELASRYVSGRCRYCVSLVTLSELIVGLARGDDEHFDENKGRIGLLCPAKKSIYFSLVGEFVRTKVLGDPPTRPEYSPRQIGLWPQIVLKARDRNELASGVALPGKRPGAVKYGFDLGKLDEYVQDGKAAHAQALQDLSSGRLQRPTQGQWVRGCFESLGIAVSAERNALLQSRLDAAFRYDSWLYDEAGRGAYDFSKHDSDWLDGQQLYYLADPDVLLVTLDRKLRLQASKSSQAKQVLDFAELLDLANNYRSSRRAGRPSS